MSLKDEAFKFFADLDGRVTQEELDAILENVFYSIKSLDERIQYNTECCKELRAIKFQVEQLDNLMYSMREEAGRRGWSNVALTPKKSSQSDSSGPATTDILEKILKGPNDQTKEGGRKKRTRRKRKKGKKTKRRR